jgi:hypothetical protein
VQGSETHAGKQDVSAQDEAGVGVQLPEHLSVVVHPSPVFVTLFLVIELHDVYVIWQVYAARASPNTSNDTTDIVRINRNLRIRTYICPFVYNSI